MDDDRERFVRWQKLSMDQLGYALNLFLTLTVAALGYWFLLLKDGDFRPGYTAKSFMILSLLALGLSAICGLACVVNRLRDFRGTAQRARNSDNHPELDGLRQLGRITWGLFYTHLGAFAAGVILLAVSLLLTYGCNWPKTSRCVATYAASSPSS